MKTTIEWSQAGESIRQERAKETQERKKYISQFLEEKHELTDGRDLVFWHEKTGKSLSWLVNNGSGIADNIKFAVNMGATADDILRIKPEHPELENEGADGAYLIFDNGHLAAHIFEADPGDFYSEKTEIFICDAADGYGYTYKTVKTEAEAIRLIESTPEEYFIKFFYEQLRNNT